MDWFIELLLRLNPLFTALFVAGVLATGVWIIRWTVRLSDKEEWQSLRKSYPDTADGRTELSLVIEHYEFVRRKGHLDPRARGYAFLRLMKERLAEITI